MDASERLRIAGEAAEILETMGFSAVARLSEGRVTLDAFRRDGREPRGVRYVVGEAALDPAALAAVVAAAANDRPGAC